MGTAQDQTLRTKRFQQNQYFFLYCTAIEGVIKKEISVVVQPVFMSPLMDYLAGFEKVTVLHMLQYLFTSYEAIY